MSPETELDKKAEDWINQHIEKLRFKQDYSICFGHTEIITEDGKQTGIKVRRPYIRLFSTGVTKLYEMIVLGDELPVVEYTPEEQKELDEWIQNLEELHEKEGK